MSGFFHNKPKQTMELPVVTRSCLINTDPAYAAADKIISFVVPERLKQISLQENYVQALQIFTTTNLAAYNQLIPFTAANIIKCTIQLATKGPDFRLIDVPLSAFVRSSNGGFYYLLDNLKLDWTQCKIKVQDVTGQVAGSVCVFEVVYFNQKDIPAN